MDQRSSPPTDPTGLPARLTAVALHRAAEAVFLLDDRDRIAYLNPAAAQILNGGADGLLGVDFIDLAPDFILPSGPEPDDDQAAEPAPLAFTSQLVAGTGRSIPVDMSIIPCLDGDRLYRWVICRDISDHLAATTALRRSETRFRSAFEDVAVGMAIFSPQGQITAANDAICRMLGYREEELVGHHFVDFTHPDDIEQSLDADRRILEGELDSAWLEKRYLHKSGRTVWVILSSTLIRDRQGRPLNFVSHIQDITARVEAWRELEEKERELERQAEHLARVNTAMKVLLDHRETERVQQERDMLDTVSKLVLPYLREMGDLRLGPQARSFLDIALDNLSRIAEPLARRLTAPQTSLTPTELKVADLIRHGLTSDQIAEALTASPHTVARHRAAIRRKLGLTNRRANLKAYLQSLATWPEPEAADGSAHNDYII